MPTPRQLPLPNLRDPRYRRPTMDVTAAKGLLDVDEDAVVKLVDYYALVAWNIASPGAARRELRILTRSVSELLDAHDGLEDPCYHSTIGSDYAVELVLPKHDKPFVTGVEIQRALNCGSTHVINLVEARCLDLVPKTDYQRGPGGSPSITLESFIQFLKTRIAC